ncbi:hypothetical protein ACVI1L_004982 [Bradyrhizobium sp. USDA 4516]
MSDHQLKFKGPGFDFDAKGWQAIVAAILIVGIGSVSEPGHDGHRHGIDP